MAAYILVIDTYCAVLPLAALVLLIGKKPDHTGLGGIMGFTPERRTLELLETHIFDAHRTVASVNTFRLPPDCWEGREGAA